MSEHTRVVLVMAALIALAVIYLWWSRRRAPGEERWLPRELRAAELAFSEKRFASRRHGLVARLDRAYRKDGRLHLVELKTRNHHAAYDSDLIELSVQRVVLQEQTGEPASDVAYVAVQKLGHGAPRPIRVRLLDEKEVEALRRRWFEVRDGRGPAAAPAERQGVCRNCGQRTHCQEIYGDRADRQRPARH